MRCFGTAVLLLAASASIAQAQVAEFGVGGGLSKFKNKNLGSGYSLDDGFNIIFRLTINSWTFFGQEFGYAYNRTKLVQPDQSDGMAYHQGFYNLLAYATPEGKRIRPFATGGGHFSNFVPPGASAVQGQGENKFGINYGGGIKIRVSERFLFRVDYKQFLTGKPFGQYFPVSGTLKQDQYSAGLSFVL
ncbi:MAG: outer membrane beta-barrel protein [Bryobacteraceae bacterium]|nr:outer membrane beta-barrel protein [Bryobacteraceae bacterium]